MTNPDRDITHHKFSSDDLINATPEQLLKYLSVWRETKLIPQETINDIVLQILTNIVSRLEIKPTPEPVSGEWWCKHPDDKLVYNLTQSVWLCSICRRTVSTVSPKPTVEDELLPCPKCGCPSQQYGVWVGQDNIRQYYFECGSPDCRWQVVAGSREAARAMWNKRVTITPTPVSGNAQQEITRLIYRLAIYERVVKALQNYYSTIVLMEKKLYPDMDDDVHKELRASLAAVDQLEKE